MRIGIDISQIVYEGTGVARYVKEMVRGIVRKDSLNTYILFGSSLRRSNIFKKFAEELEEYKNIELKVFHFPPYLLDLLWNKLHIVPIESFIGPIDYFWSSDWTQPPLKNSQGITTIHDLIVLKYPDETNNTTSFSLQNIRFKPNIVETQKRRLGWAKKECEIFLCDSQATKKDAVELLGIQESKLHVVYPGYN